MNRRFALVRNILMAFAVLGAGVVYFASPASAHHPVVTGEVVCNQATGKYDVTWTISSDADRDKVWQLTSINRSIGLAVPTAYQADEVAFTGAESVDPGAGTLTLNVGARWEDKDKPGYGVATGNRSGSVTIPDAPCAQPKDAVASVSVDPPTCTEPAKLVLGDATHATFGPVTGTSTGPGTYSVTATADDGHLFGNGQSTMTFSGTLADKLDPDSDDCAGTTAAAEVSLTPPTCQYGEKLVLGEVTNATWGPVTGTRTGPGNYSVTATADAGFRFSDGSRTKTFTGTLAGPLDADDDACAETSAVAAVTTTPPDCFEGETLVYGEIENATFSGTPDGTEGPGDYGVTATADDGFRFADGSKTQEFTGTLSGPIDADDDRCAAPDALAEVDTTPADCEGAGTLVYGDIENATFSGTPNGTEGPGDYSVTATADDGFRFADGSKTQEFTGTLEGPFGDKQYFEECAPPQPPAEEREVAGAQGDCETQGVTTFVDVYTTPYMWNAETREWEPGAEVGPVRTQEEFTPYTDEEFAEECGDDIETLGEEGEVLDQPIEVKGEQETVPDNLQTVPGAVEAGERGELPGPLGAAQRNPLWLLLIGGGLGLMGTAGLRRRTTADR